MPIEEYDGRPDLRGNLGCRNHMFPVLRWSWSREGSINQEASENANQGPNGVFNRRPCESRAKRKFFARFSSHAGSVDLGTATWHREKKEYSFLTRHPLECEYRTRQKYQK